MDYSNIDTNITTTLITLGGSLATLALKGTATMVHSKITTLKSEKNLETVRSAYDELINVLLQEREEAIVIAQTYKSEIERVYISDEDMEYLHNTISKVLELLKAYSGDTIDITSLESLKELINKDVLKTMQLLGFNYKEAIGKPLTNLCANAIESVGKKKHK